MSRRASAAGIASLEESQMVLRAEVLFTSVILCGTSIARFLMMLRGAVDVVFPPVFFSPEAAVIRGRDSSLGTAHSHGEASYVDRCGRSAKNLTN